LVNGIVSITFLIMLFRLKAFGNFIKPGIF